MQGKCQRKSHKTPEAWSPRGQPGQPASRHETRHARSPAGLAFRLGEHAPHGYGSHGEALRRADFLISCSWSTHAGAPFTVGVAAKSAWGATVLGVGRIPESRTGALMSEGDRQDARDSLVTEKVGRRD
jgi:hypothetical protein